jgi:hypothetical protein
MSYYHQNPDYGVYAYEYEDKGNHGNGNYKYEHDSYSDYNESDHNISEPDYHNNETDPPWDKGPETGQERCEETGGAHKHGRLEYEGGEPNREDYEQERLECERIELTGGEYKDEERENEARKPQERGYNEALELKLERMSYEWGHEPERFERRGDQTYKPQRLEQGNNGVHEPEYELDRKREPRETDNGIHAPPTAFAGEHDGDNDAHGLTHASEHAVEPHSYHPTNAIPAPLLYTPNYKPQRPRHDSNEALELRELESMYAKWGYEPPELAAVHSAYGGTADSTTTTPAPLPPPHPPTHFPPTPTPNPLEHDSLHLNQRGHVTALKSCESTPNTTYNDDDRCCVNRVEPDADERLELEELERMYAEWGHEAPEPTTLHSAHGGTNNSAPAAPSLQYLPVYDDDDVFEFQNQGTYELEELEYKEPHEPEYDRTYNCSEPGDGRHGVYEPHQLEPFPPSADISHAHEAPQLKHRN